MSEGGSSRGEKKVNVPLLIASLIISFTLWAAVYAQNLPVTTRQVEVDLLPTGLDQSQFALYQKPDRLRVWVTGSDQQINELRDLEKFGEVDLSRSARGERMYPVVLQPSLLRQLAHDQTPEVRINVQPLTRRSVRVTPQTTGKLPNDEQRLDNLVVEPESVNISGPQPLVDQVAELRAFLDLERTDPKRAAPYNLPVEAVDNKGRRIQGLTFSPVSVAVTPIFIPTPEEKTASVLVRFRGKVAPGYEQAAYTVDRDNVVLIGPSYALATVSSVETEPVDVSGLSAPREFIASLRPPPGVSAVRPARIKVRVIVRKRPTPVEAPSGVTP